MKINPFKIIGYLIIIGFAAAFLLLPRGVELYGEREMEVSASELFDTMNTISSWQVWSPWKFEQDHFNTKYEGGKTGVGAKYIWKSDSIPSMNGRLEITKSEKNKYLRGSIFYDVNGEEPAYEIDFYFKEHTSNNENVKSILGYGIEEEVGFFHLPNRFLMMGAQEELSKTLDTMFTKLDEYIKK